MGVPLFVGGAEAAAQHTTPECTVPTSVAAGARVPIEVGEEPAAEPQVPYGVWEEAAAEVWLPCEVREEAAAEAGVPHEVCEKAAAGVWVLCEVYEEAAAEARVPYEVREEALALCIAAPGAGAEVDHGGAAEVLVLLGQGAEIAAKAK